MNALVQLHPPFTSAEFYRMADKGAFAGLRVELRRGMILKMSPQYLGHGHVQGELLRALNVAIHGIGAPWRVQAGTTIAYGGGFEPMPDIVVIDPVLTGAMDGPIPPEAVMLVVEVADSSLADDMGEKREDYARAGLKEYWVADVQAKTVIRHADPQGDRFLKEEMPLGLDQPLAMLTRPDLVVRI